MRKFSWMLNVFFSFNNQIFTTLFYKSIQSPHPSSGPHLTSCCFGVERDRPYYREL